MAKQGDIVTLGPNSRHVTNGSMSAGTRMVVERVQGAGIGGFTGGRGLMLRPEGGGKLIGAREADVSPAPRRSAASTQAAGAPPTRKVPRPPTVARDSSAAAHRAAPHKAAGTKLASGGATSGLKIRRDRKGRFA